MVDALDCFNNDEDGLKQLRKLVKIKDMFAVSYSLQELICVQGCNCREKVYI